MGVMSEWKEVKLGNFFKVKHGFAFKGKNITYEESLDVLVTPGNFHIGGGFKFNKFKYFNGEYPQDYILHENDIVITMTDLSKETDTLGYSAKVPKSKNGENYLHNQRVGLVQFNNANADSDYLYWLMRTREYQGYVVGSASGTSIMHTSPSRIEDYQFLIPPLPEQKAIAEVLSSLDDKIDLLHRQNKTLEQMAETLFRQWFIEDKPQPSLNPSQEEGSKEAKEDWEEGVLSDLVKVKYGKDHKKLSNGNVPVYGSGGIMRYAEKALFENESVLIPCKGTLNNVTYINEPFWTVDTMFYTIMKKSNLAKFIYHFVKEKDLALMNVGSAVPSMTTQVLNNMPLQIPSDENLKHFEDTVTPYYQKMKLNQNQIHTLEKMRDTLLPKLINGKVRVETHGRASQQ